MDPQPDMEEHRGDTREHQDDQPEPAPASVDEHQDAHEHWQQQVELDLELEGPGGREAAVGEQGRVVVLEEQQVAQGMVEEMLVAGQQRDAHQRHEVCGQQARHPADEIRVDRHPTPDERTRHEEAGQDEEDEDAPVAVLEQTIERCQATTFAGRNVVTHDRDGRERAHGVQAQISSCRVGPHVPSVGRAESGRQPSQRV